MSIVRSDTREPIVLRMANALMTYIGLAENADDRAYLNSMSKQPRLKIVRHAQAAPSRPRVRLHEIAPRLRSVHLSEHARAARHNAIRGLTAARSGDTNKCLRYWRKAVLAENIDLSALPGFWDLTRAHMHVAVEAYDQAGKYQESAALEEQIAHVCRPQLVGKKVRTGIVVPRGQRAANT